jgi:hypothetical protein
MKRKLIIILLLIFSISACDFIKYGYPEAQFKLSPESRLPKWVDIPSGYTRNDLTMTITYHVHLSGSLSRAKMVVKSLVPDSKVLLEIVGKYYRHPLTKKQEWDVYPKYTVITVNGLGEVFEKRQKGNVLHITDAPKATAVFKEQ